MYAFSPKVSYLLKIPVADAPAARLALGIALLKAWEGKLKDASVRRSEAV